MKEQKKKLVYRRVNTIYQFRIKMATVYLARHTNKDKMVLDFKSSNYHPTFIS